MKFAAFVGLVAGGEDDSLWPHACLSGEGTAGVVGFVGNAEVRRRGAETPLMGEVVDTSLLAELGLAPLETGNGYVGTPLGRDGGGGAVDRIGGAETGWGDAKTGWEDADGASSPTRRLFVSVLGDSGGSSLIFEGDGRGTKEGEL
jgi:hypothetical protein